MLYVAGWNQPGCLPDTAEPLPTFGTFNEAVKYLVGEVDRMWDEAYQGCLDADERDSADNVWLPIHTALASSGVAVDSGTHTFNDSADGLSFWINPAEEDEPAEEPPSGAFNDPRMACCGRDAADCDCEHPREA